MQDVRGVISDSEEMDYLNRIYIYIYISAVAQNVLNQWHLDTGRLGETLPESLSLCRRISFLSGAERTVRTIVCHILWVACA